jgi:hypothetical protein
MGSERKFSRCTEPGIARGGSTGYQRKCSRYAIPRSASETYL